MSLAGSDSRFGGVPELISAAVKDTDAESWADHCRRHKRWDDAAKALKAKDADGVRQFLDREGFVDAYEKPARLCKEIYWTTGGYSGLGFRVMEHDFGWWAIVFAGGGTDRAVNLGTVHTLADLIALYQVLRVTEHALWRQEPER